MSKKFKVPFNYLQYEFKNPTKIFQNWKKLIKSTEFTLGPYVQKFENRFAKFVGSKFCISTNNGTDALILSLKALGIKKGDEVITVCNSFYATTGAIIAVGAKPVFTDCDDRYQMKINQIEQLITKKTRAIIPVHWAGASPKMNQIIKIAKKNKIEVIEDACMGIGGKCENQHPGTFGIIGAFSMHPLKSLNAMGDGGMIVTNDSRIASWALKFRNHGMVDRDHIDFWGVNMRLQPLQAVVGIEGLKKIKKTIIKRNRNAYYLDRGLKKIEPFVKTPNRLNNYTETFSLFMILCHHRDKLQKYLNSNGIETKIHYPIPLHLQKAAKKLGYKKGSFLNAESQARKLLSLPVHQFISLKQIKYMLKHINTFYKNNY